ncbi:MAG: LytTR family DNA-binding domain-containing protein [Lachnospiraceae bacterium]|nr:LytTR family DNA-binding domain-containing protein [Lachnospiraceae bacterium]
MTYLTALCDDETAELNKTEKLLNAYEQEHPEVDFMIERFESADELIYRIEDKNYAPDLIFMDIFMPGPGGVSDSLGMEAAKKLRDMGSRAKLFFLSTSREYAVEAFDVEALQYLLKPISQERLFGVLDKFLDNEEEERKRCILLKMEGRLVRVPVTDIVYCEAQGKTQRLHFADGRESQQRMTMMELFDLLSPYQEFVKIGAAFIVNLEYIDSLSAQDICLTGGRKIYLPRGAYKGLREQYFNYYCRN